MYSCQNRPEESKSMVAQNCQNKYNETNNDKEPMVAENDQEKNNEINSNNDRAVAG